MIGCKICLICWNLKGLMKWVNHVKKHTHTQNEEEEEEERVGQNDFFFAPWP
jgi:hypothetical protein